jgi:CMP-N,N'-diacetyllegionaminic acid synthase
MHQGKTFLAIIPARGGSKRLPRKNLLDLAGKPLIAWTIQAALGCPLIDEVMVTTDDDEIAGIAKEYGAAVPFIRPKALASDTTTSFDVVKHVIEFYQSEMGKKFDFILLLQPTSPLRNSQHITEAINLLSIKNADAIVSVCEVEHSPLWANVLPADHSMVCFLRENVINKRSQDLKVFYRLNGAIYICDVNVLLDKKKFLIDDAIYAYPMLAEHSVDIDNQIDLFVSKAILRNNQGVVD